MTREYEDPRERDFDLLLRSDIAAIALERREQAYVLSPEDCADLIRAFSGCPFPEDIVSWMVIPLEDGRQRGKPRRRLKAEAVLRRARTDYRAYVAWLRARDVARYTRILGLARARWWKGAPHERALATLRRKYGSELAGYDEPTLERHLRGK